MILLGALAFGVFIFFIVGLVTGNAPRVEFGFKSSKPKSDVSKRQIWLNQAGLELSPAQYYGGLAAVALVTLALVAAITGVPVVALAPAAGAVAVPHAYFSQRRIKNMAKTQQAWPDAIMEIIASIESNASLHGALVALAYRGPEALRSAFGRFPSMASTLGVVPALEVIRERLSDPTSDRVIEVLILAHERGGGIVTDILRDLSHATTEDLQLQEEIVSAQLEQKINGRAVFIIPWAVLIMIVFTSPDFATFYKSRSGIAVVVVGAILSLLGMLTLAKLGKDKDEPRVFGGSAVSADASS